MYVCCFLLFILCVLSFFFSSRRRHTSCALVTGVQTCALPIFMLRKLAAYERQNQLDVALQEIGKIERTLFMLDWLKNPDLRRRCHAGLNNSEQRHAQIGRASCRERVCPYV